MKLELQLSVCTLEQITYIIIILIFIHVQLVGKFAQLKGRFTVVSELERHRLAVHEYCESDSNKNNEADDRRILR